jgi:predicted HAD superfamily Cof-like phosphohydrolase
MSGILNWVLEWHKRACPHPDHKAFTVQLGCHCEEVAEMMDTIQALDQQGAQVIEEAAVAMRRLADMLKAGHRQVIITNRTELLDSLADQMVTAVGVGYRAGMQPIEALTEVDVSNWSKFDEKGQPIFDANGKVTKGPRYQKPDLGGLT